MGVDIGAPAVPVPGRHCGTCSLCCKLLAVPALEKPTEKWCAHCDVGRGCRIYDRRPGECRAFTCGFLTLAQLSEAWRPSTCKFVLLISATDKRLVADIDPGFPAAWRVEPYYSQLKEWARFAVAKRWQVMACLGRRTTVILPDEDVDLGLVTEDETILTGERDGPLGVELNAIKVKSTDPRAVRFREANRP